MTEAEVRLTIAAESRFIALVRVTAASLAAELDFTVDEIEELRVGANELVSLLIETAEDHDVDRVDLTFEVTDDTITMRGSVQIEGEVVEVAPLDFLTEQILGAVVDDYELSPVAGRISKRRATV